MAAELTGQYMGMTLVVPDIDTEDLEYFQFCGAHEFRLQSCTACGLLRYPPTTACPWCSNDDATWQPVEGRGTVYSYAEIAHAIQPAFREHTPYHLLLVELDTQRGQPTEHESLRIVGNLVEPDGTLARPETVARCGIGSRVRMVFVDVSPGFALPQWTLDDEGTAAPWRYPDT